MTMTSLIRNLCLLVSLVCFFFGAYYIFSDNVETGLWAIISGTLLMFIREFIVIGDYDDDDLI